MTDNNSNVLGLERRDGGGDEIPDRAQTHNNGSLTDLILGGLDTEDGIMLSAGSSFVPSASNTSVFFYNFNAPGEGSQLVEGITGRVVVYLQGGDDLLINLRRIHRWTDAVH